MTNSCVRKFVYGRLICLLVYSPYTNINLVREYYFGILLGYLFLNKFACVLDSVKLEGLFIVYLNSYASCKQRIPLCSIISFHCLNTTILEFIVTTSKLQDRNTQCTVFYCSGYKSAWKIYFTVNNTHAHIHNFVAFTDDLIKNRRIILHLMFLKNNILQTLGEIEINELLSFTVEDISLTQFKTTILPTAVKCLGHKFVCPIMRKIVIASAMACKICLLLLI